MKKILFYGMTGEKMCFQHIFLNAIDLQESGYEVKIIFCRSFIKKRILFISRPESVNS